MALSDHPELIAVCATVIGTELRSNESQINREIETVSARAEQGVVYHRAIIVG